MLHAKCLTVDKFEKTSIASLGRQINYSRRVCLSVYRKLILAKETGEKENYTAIAVTDVSMYSRYVNGSRGFSLDFPAGLVCRRIHGNPGQTEPRLWGKLSWKMRRCGPTTTTGCARRRVHRSWLPEVSSNIAERRMSAREFVGPRVQGRIRRCRPWTSIGAIELCYRILGVFSSDATHARLLLSEADW